MAIRDDEFLVKYEVEDGYMGGSRPQSFRINSDLLTEEMTDDEIERSLYEATQEDMLQKISPVVNNSDEFVAWARIQIAKRNR